MTTPIYSRQRIELATFLIEKKANGPDTAIRCVFDGMVKGLEIHGHAVITPAIKERVWNHVKPQKVAALQAQLINDYCKHVLLPFPDADIDSALAELKEHEEILEPRLCFMFNFVAASQLDSLKQNLILNAQKLTTNWSEVIVKAFQDEGVVVTFYT